MQVRLSISMQVTAVANSSSQGHDLNPQTLSCLQAACRDLTLVAMQGLVKQQSCLLISVEASASYVMAIDRRILSILMHLATRVHDAMT